MDAPYPRAECVNVGEAGRSGAVIVETLHRFGARGSHFHALSLGSVGLCIGLWIRAKTVDQDERGNAERRALFVGLWAPTLWQMGDSLQREDERSLVRGRRHSRLQGFRSTVPW
jgi:hypothetical protein